MSTDEVVRHLAGGKGTEAFLDACRRDRRRGVREAVRALERRREAAAREARRLEMLYSRELAVASGALLVGGIDEAGRGPLAGPVVAACVILPRQPRLEGIDDSKKLAPRRREELAGRIRAIALGVGVGVVGPDTIDRVNILNATLEAARRAVLACKPRHPQALLTDALTVPGLTMPQEGIVGADASIACVAAASIVAKVHRDGIMVELDGRYPGYGFAQHKGYGTREHLAALTRLGPSPIHRQSFLHSPAVDPVGAFVVLRRRLEGAASLEDLEAAAAAVGTVKAALGSARLTLLRRAFTRRRRAITGAG